MKKWFKILCLRGDYTKVVDRHGIDGRVLHTLSHVDADFDGKEVIRCLVSCYFAFSGDWVSRVFAI